VEDGLLKQTVGEDGRPARVVTRVDREAFADVWLSTVTTL
jgi:hypothetical protein